MTNDKSKNTSQAKQVESPQKVNKEFIQEDTPCQKRKAERKTSDHWLFDLFLAAGDLLIVVVQRVFIGIGHLITRLLD